MSRDLWRAYGDANRQFSERHMADSSKPLNQRKIAACYVQAILAVRPLEVDLEDERCTVPPERSGRVAYECGPFVACAIAVAGIFLTVHLVTKTDAVDVETERLRRLNPQLRDLADVPSMIRREQAKMLNGGFPASEVDFLPSNRDI